MMGLCSGIASSERILEIHNKNRLGDDNNLDPAWPEDVESGRYTRSEYELY